MRKGIETERDGKPRRGRTGPIGYRGMRLSRILFLYVAREILLYSCLGFIIVTAVLLGQNLVRRLDDLVFIGLSPPDFFAVVTCLFPVLAASAIPLAFLMGALLAVRRIASDSELTAMRASGLGTTSLLVPSLLIGIATSALTAYLVLEVEPAARRELRTLLKTMATRGSLLEPGKFRGFGGRLIYVENRDVDNNLVHVMIEDVSDQERPFLIFAERGKFSFDAKDERIRLRLENGALHLMPQAGEAERYRRISFDVFDYAFDVTELLSGATARLRPGEMDLADLRSAATALRAGESMSHLRESDPIEYELQLHRRLVLPFAPALFALIAVPLGARLSRGGRPAGLLLAIGVVFSYYALLSLADFTVRAGVTVLALWLPNLWFAAFAIALLRDEQRRVGP